MRLRFSKLLATSVVLSAALISPRAHASLTQAETTQVREFYVGAKPNDAGNVRALVARPDLTADESAAAMAAAIGSIAFTPQRAAFLHALLFAGASLPSRSVLAVATTRGVLGRVSEVLAKFPGDFDTHADAVAEVTRLLVFLEQEIASPAATRGVGAASQSGIALAAYDDCVKALVDTMTMHPRWLTTEGKLSLVATKVRAQADLLLLDMMNDSPTYRVDAADKLALTGARRAFYIELGVLLLDDSRATDVRVEAAKELFLRLPAARTGVLGVFFGDDKAVLVGGGARKKEVLVLKSVLAPPAPLFPVDLLPESLPKGAVAPGAARIDPALADLARELSLITVKRALANRGDLSLQSTRDAQAAIAANMPLGKAFPATPPTDANAVLAQAVELVAIDARAAFDIAKARFHGNATHLEPAALFSDAVGILAVYAPPAQAGNGLSLAVGRPKGDGSSPTAVPSSETVIASNVRLAPSGVATGLMLNGSQLSIGRDPSGEVTSLWANDKLAPSPVKRPDSKLSK